MRALLGVVAALLVTSSASAEPEVEELSSDCVATYEDALAQKKKGALVAAHERFAECTQPSCPGPVREECAVQIRKLSTLIPTVVPRATGSDGKELVEVRVMVDGRPLTERLDGRAHRLDPGPHTFQFQAPDLPPTSVRVVLAEGELLRRVEAVIDTGENASSGDAPIPTLTWVLGGVGVAGLIGFTAFALSGLSKESDLEACEPNCSTSETDDLKQTYLFADISLAIGILGLGGATYFYVTSRSDPAPTAPADASARTTIVGVGGAF
jgi:hypothetical protein